MITLIDGAEVYAPEPLGVQPVLLLDGKIAKVGSLDQRALLQLGLEVSVIDARGCMVVPGFIDPHEHLLGGSGERGFASQTPELALSEIASAGITTVVGCLGVDTTTKTMTGLLAKARAFREEGISAFIYSGGYDVPPVTLTGSLRLDMLLVPEVIGSGEVAISDLRSTCPSDHELARLASEAYVGGILTGKAGVMHVHVGDGRTGLAPLCRLLDEHEISPATIYPTHVERNERLMREAVALTRRGVVVDVDTVECDLAKWVRFYLEEGGDLSMLTASSDASIPSPATLSEQLRGLVREGILPLERALSLVTTNTARVLKLTRKGALRADHDADLVVLNRELEVVHVVAGGRQLVRDGRFAITERFLEQSNRVVELRGLRASRQP
nr:Isoaspartyl dipeptidase [uncultured bacterium]